MRARRSAIQKTKYIQVSLLIFLSHQIHIGSGPEVTTEADIGVETVPLVVEDLESLVTPDEVLNREVGLNLSDSPPCKCCQSCEEYQNADLYSPVGHKSREVLLQEGLHEGVTNVKLVII